MRISDWSSDVCFSDLFAAQTAIHEIRAGREVRGAADDAARERQLQLDVGASGTVVVDRQLRRLEFDRRQAAKLPATVAGRDVGAQIFQAARSEEHTSELQSLMRISYAVFCLKKKHKPKT